MSFSAACKAHSVIARFMYGLKPVPFIGLSFIFAPEKPCPDAPKIARGQFYLSLFTRGGRGRRRQARRGRTVVSAQSMRDPSVMLWP